MSWWEMNNGPKLFISCIEDVRRGGARVPLSLSRTHPSYPVSLHWAPPLKSSSISQKCIRLGTKSLVQLRVGQRTLRSKTAVSEKGSAYVQHGWSAKKTLKCWGWCVGDVNTVSCLPQHVTLQPCPVPAGTPLTSKVP